MARVRVPLAAFHSGALPPVCAKTGEPADRLLPVRASYTPRWTWLLLLLVVLSRLAWPLAFFGGCVLVAFLFGFGWVWLLGGGEVGAHFDPEAPTVLLWGVHERFKRAVEGSAAASRRVLSATG